MNSISGTLLFNGKSLNNASEFNPNSVPIIFSGSTLPTDDTTGKITAMITNLKTAYSSSDISGNSNIAGLLSATGTTAIVNLGTAIVTNQLGGKAVAVSESGKINVCKTSSVIDADNNPYNTVSIGTQCWMKTNLRTTKNPDGTSITKGNAGHGSGGWDDSTTKYYGCPPNVNNTMEDCDVAATYGLLYQWPAAMNGSTVPGAQGICPDGWHVPTDAEFTILVESQANIAGCDAGSSWQCPNAGSKLGGGEADWFTFTGGIKLDSSGVVRPEFGKSDFNALPTGYRFFNSNYTDRTKYATFWSSTPIESSNSVRARRFSSNLPTVWRASLARPFGYSLRCIQN